MALRNALQRVHPKWPKRNMLQWGGVLAVGVAAVGLRSITSAGIPGSFRVVTPPNYTSIVNTLKAFSRPRSFSAITIPSTSMAITPPQPPPEWTHSAEDVVKLTKECIASHRAVEDKIGALPPSDCTYESVFVSSRPTDDIIFFMISSPQLALEAAETEFESITEPLSFYQNVSPSKALRDASTDADGLVRDYNVESSMRLDVFQAKLAAEKNIKSSGLWEKLSSEEQRLIDKMILEGKRAGLGLPEAERNTLTKLQKELSQVCLEFDKNFNEENVNIDGGIFFWLILPQGVVSFTKEDLDGVPADVISGYTKRTEGSTEVYDVTFKTPDIFPVFKFATRPETRQKAYEGHESRLKINVPLVEKFLGLRREIAKVLKYPTWADYRTEPKMVKTGQGVVDFLDDLEAKLKPVGLKDRETLLGLKKKEHEERGLPFDGNLYIWDYRYYDRKFIETSLELDDMLVKEYFPVSVVVPAIMQIYQSLLGVRFETINGSTWHPDVQQFSVWEKDATDASGFIGYCYLDLFPRESKYSHAAVWPILSGYTKADGKRSYPLAAMVANLAKSTPDKPALMRHDDVVTFFHEMGHVFHGLLSQTKFAKFHGTKVARDFVEAPSQMLENWCWEPEVLTKMSSHYQTQQALSPALIDKIIKSRYVNVGLFYLRQVFFAKFDIKVHTDQEAEDYTLLWNNLREKISLVKSEKPCPGQGSFGHISGGYDAGYYGYTYSLVFASDMYSTVFKGGPLDPARGKLYRDKILKYGGSREELDSLEDFLGRPPNSDAFLKELFGTEATVSASL
ncbi:Metallopeptidase MepB [Mycena sanguinolenta]|uniref:Metallopeptidase MepB n=1 Tax=Mycena sanguinolenta TaxID=230812 RepID=A0A8H6XTP7_9AGAR|nr:Metallopeptidase MepB [Mycena sanguinolenta]